jgi:hypothetical protein
MFVFADNIKQRLPVAGDHWNPSSNWHWLQMMR